MKNHSANAGDTRDMGLIPWSGRSPGEGNGNQLQCFCWEIPWTEEPDGLQSMGSQRKCELSTLVIQRPPAKEGTSEVFRTGPTLCRGLLSILLDRSRTLEIPTWNRKFSPTPTASLVTWQVKNPPSNAGDTRDMGLVLGSRRSP